MNIMGGYFIRKYVYVLRWITYFYTSVCMCIRGGLRVRLRVAVDSVYGSVSLYAIGQIIITYIWSVRIHTI